MWKNILSVIAGLIVGFLIIVALEVLSNKLYPQPPFFDLKKADWDTAKFFVEMIPVGAFLIVLSGFALGSLSGGFLSCLISKKKQASLIVGTAILIAGILNLFRMPQPLWFTISSLLIILPLAFLGGIAGIRLKKKKG